MTQIIESPSIKDTHYSIVKEKLHFKSYAPFTNNKKTVNVVFYTPIKSRHYGETWETVSDFTGYVGGGIDADELLKHL